MTRLVVVCLLVVFACESIYGMQYSASLVGATTKNAVCPTITVQGAVQWAPQQYAGACAGKKINSLFVTYDSVGNGKLSLCDGVARGPSKKDPLILLQEAALQPTYLLTATTHQGALFCDTSRPDSLLEFKNRLFDLDNKWNAFDAACQAEFGIEYSLASVDDVPFAFDGKTAPISSGLALSDHDPSILALVRGGYVFALDTAEAGSFNNPQVYPWQTGFVHADCYGGLGDKYTPKNADFCNPNSPWQIGFYDNSLSYPIFSETSSGYAPVLCKRSGAQVSTFIKDLYKVNLPEDRCEYIFGSGYTTPSVYDLHRQVKSPFPYADCELRSVSACYNSGAVQVQTDEGSVYATITSAGAPSLESANGPCLSQNTGLTRGACTRTNQFQTLPPT